jgi:AI-2 transport protein TqsA
VNSSAGDDTPGPSAAAASPWTVLRWLLVTATAWFLLKELAPILRPLLLAVFLAYVVLPVRLFVQGHARRGVGHLALLAGVGIVLAGLTVLTYANLVDLSGELPRLHERTKEILTQASNYARERVPQLADALVGTAKAEELGSSRIQSGLQSLMDVTAGVLIEAVQVAFYLLLILFEAGRLMQRTRDAVASDRADRVLTMVASINVAIASYLKVKVKVNVILAVPVMVVLWACGVKFVLLWGVLTFFANFVPYLGSLVACALPMLFAFLDLDFGWKPLAVTILLPAIHVSSAYLVEPAMTGKAVNLSPLVVLIALSFWGLCWGLIGMVLAVPLTAVLKIILESYAGTRPIAALMGDD